MQPSDQSRGPLTAFGWALIVAALLVLGGAVALYFSRPEGLPSGAPTTFELATEPFTNTQGGYSIQYPPKWKVDEFGSVTRVVSPRRDASITFGNAPDGPLRDSVSRLLARVLQSYRRPQITGIEVRNLAGSLAALVAGSGENREGVPLRFLVISVATEPGNFGITVFAAQSSDPQKVLPPVQEMVASFQPVVA